MHRFVKRTSLTPDKSSAIIWGGKMSLCGNHNTNETLCALFIIGKSTLIVLAVAKYEWFEEWKEEKVTKRGAEYEAFKNCFVDNIMETVLKFYPQIKDKVRALLVSHHQLCKQQQRRNFSALFK